MKKMNAPVNNEVVGKKKVINTIPLIFIISQGFGIPIIRRGMWTFTNNG